MNILIAYATTEGQTRKIAQFAFETLTRAGHAVALMPAEEARAIDLAPFDGVILAASVHSGTYQQILFTMVKERRKELAKVPVLFLSVSLSAAGKDESDWQGLREVVDGFVTETRFQPTRVEHVAGAFRFGDYGFFTYWAMRWIAHQKGEKVTQGETREYTDWDALQAVLAEWGTDLAEAA